MAYAGHARNHVDREGSSHPQVVTVVGWLDQTCHHNTIDNNR